MRINLPDGWKEVTAAKYWTGSKWASLTRGLFYDGTEWQEIAKFTELLEVELSSGDVYGFVATPQPSAVTSSSVTASPSGGLGPYQYLWEFISGNASTALQPNFASTSFRNGNVPANNVETSVFRVTVTDALGSEATAQVTAQFENFGDFN